MANIRQLVNKNKLRTATAKHALLEILKNRTGEVSSDEIYGAFVNNWEIPEDLKQDSRQWIAVMLCELKRIGLIENKGMYKEAFVSDAGRAGAAKKAMYDITTDGLEFLASCENGIIPKVPKSCDSAKAEKEKQGLIDIEHPCIKFARLPAPNVGYRKPKPAAQHIYQRMGIAA